MKKNKGKILNITLVIVLIIITNILTFFVANTLNLSMGNKVVIDASDKVAAKNINKMIALKNVLKEDFYKELDDQTLWDSAISGLYAGSGDNYTAYYNEKDFKEYTQSFEGTYTGIGVEIVQLAVGEIRIESVFPDSPAQKAGLKAGDFIVKAKGKSTAKMTSSEVSNLLRGKPHTKVNLTVERNNKEIDVNLTRQTLEIQYVESKVIDKKIGYIKINQFQENVYKSFLEQYNSLIKKNINGLIIDLRDNPGGIVEEATDIAKLMLPKGNKIISTTNKSGKVDTILDDTEVEAIVPMVVLINGNSASSAEILTVALKDNGVAKVVGEKSYGKGIIQAVKSVKSGGGISITTDEYLGPKGEKIHEKGVKPDVVVKLKSDKPASSIPMKKDTQLKKAIEILK